MQQLTTTNGQAIEPTSAEAEAQDLADAREALAEAPAPRSIGEHLRQEEARSRTLTESEIKERHRRRGGEAGVMQATYYLRTQSEETLAARLAPPEKEGEDGSPVRAWWLTADARGDFVLGIRAPSLLAALQNRVQAERVEAERSRQAALEQARQGPAHQRREQLRRQICETKQLLEEARLAEPAGWAAANEAIRGGKDPTRHERSALKAREQQEILSRRLEALEPLLAEIEGDCWSEDLEASEEHRKRQRASCSARQAIACERVAALVEQLILTAVECGLHIQGAAPPNLSR